MIPAILLLAAAVPGVFRLVIREIRHINHILMGKTLTELYRLITGKMIKNRAGEIRTAAWIRYYDFLKRCYRHNYHKEHP